MQVYRSTPGAVVETHSNGARASATQLPQLHSNGARASATQLPQLPPAPIFPPPPAFVSKADFQPPQVLLFHLDVTAVDITHGEKEVAGKKALWLASAKGEVESQLDEKSGVGCG